MKSFCIAQGKLFSFSTDEQRGKVEVSEVLVKLPYQENKGEFLNKSENGLTSERSGCASPIKFPGCYRLASVPETLRFVEFSTQHAYLSSSFSSPTHHIKEDDPITRYRCTPSSPSLYPCYLRLGIFLSLWLSVELDLGCTVGEKYEETAYSSFQDGEDHHFINGFPSSTKTLTPLADGVEVNDVVSSSSPLLRISSRNLLLSQLHSSLTASDLDSSRGFLNNSDDIIRLDPKEFAVWRRGYDVFQAKRRQLLRQKNALKEEGRSVFASRRRSLERGHPL